MTRALILAATLLVATALQPPETPDKPKAFGNMGVHYDFSKIISTNANPLTANASGTIWCTATLNGDQLPIVNASFVRYRDALRRTFAQDKKNTLFKSSLTIGEVVVDNMGKYRCDIVISANNSTENSTQIVQGNLYVYSSPFFHTDGSMNMHVNATTGVVTADALRAPKGSDFDIHCPAVGFPIPNITWFKNDTVIKPSDRLRFSNNDTVLTIVKVSEEDKGVYGCTAVNKYPTRLDVDWKPHKASLRQELTIGGRYGSLLPLFIILVALLLLFIIIYACAACKRYKHENYNIAKREKRLLRTPSPDCSEDSTMKSELVSSA